MDALGGFANLPAAELARILCASSRSAQRWKQRRSAPAWVLRVLRVLLWGDLGLICPAWDGWALRGGKLHAPCGAVFTLGEIQSIPLRLQQISALERERRGLRASTASADDRAPTAVAHTMKKEPANRTTSEVSP